MAFSLSNNIITQTGTNDNLDGLGNIAGVTVISLGSGIYRKRVYFLGSLRFVVDGTVTHDPEVEVIVGDAQDMLQVNGTYNYGIQRTINGETVYSESTGIVSTFVSGNVFSQNGIILGGTFNWNGGDIEYASVISIPSSGVINQNAGGLIHKNPTQGNQIRIGGGATTNFNDLRISAPNAETPRLFSFDAFDTLRLTPINAAFQTFTQFVNANVELRDYANGSNAANSDVVWNGQSEDGIYRVSYINAERFVSCQPGNANLAGLTSTYKEYNFSALDLDNNSLDEAVIYFAEQDDGNTEVVNTYDLTVLEQTVLETDGNGKVSATPLVVNTYKKHGNTFSVVTNQRYNTDDTITLQVWRYGSDPASLTVPYYGLASASDIDIVMFDDGLATLTKSEAEALTEVSTLDELYDVAMLWKVQPIKERIEYPEVDERLFNLNDTALDLGNLSLVVDENATDVFAVDTPTNTVTVKSSSLIAGEKFTSILSTGTATGTIDAPVIDANGDSFVEESQGRTFDIYATDQDRDAKVNALENNTVRFRFNFTTSETYYLWVKLGNTEIPAQINTVAGENVVDLGSQGQLIGLFENQQIINRGVQKSSLLIPHNEDIQ